MGSLISRIKTYFTRDKEPIELLLEQMEKERERPIYKRPIYKRKTIKNYRYYTDGTLFEQGPTEIIDTDIKYSLSDIR